jgi:hypothetical protein
MSGSCQEQQEEGEDDTSDTVSLASTLSGQFSVTAYFFIAVVRIRNVFLGSGFFHPVSKSRKVHS